MPRCLRDDYRMYYNGTFITRVNDAGEVEVMNVGDVTYINNGYTPAHIVMIGNTYGLDKNGKVTTLTTTQWTGADIRPHLPEAGYYLIGSTPLYIEFSLQNRSNRKGFEPSRTVVDGAGYRLSTNQIVTMFLKPDFKGKLFQDCCIAKSRILWRGDDVGSFHDGVMELNETFEYLRDHLGKQIELFRNNGGN